MIIRFIILCSTMLFVQYYAISQTANVKGVISGANDKQALPGAHIILNEQRQIAISDFEGKYRLTNIPFRTYELSISHVGFATITESIVVSEQECCYDFEMQEQVYLANEAIITATGTKIARKDVSPAISVVAKQTLEESRESALLPVINEHVPGVFVTERGVTGFGLAGGAAGKISIRGVGGNPNTGILVLIDGVPQYMGLFGHPLPDSYVSSDAEKVEVIRGPASMMRRW